MIWLPLSLSLSQALTLSLTLALTPSLSLSPIQTISLQSELGWREGRREGSNPLVTPQPQALIRVR